MDNVKHLCIVTGATGGLGGSFVKELASKENDLIISGTKPDRVENLKRELIKEYPNIRVYAKACNLADEKSRTEFFEYIKAEKLVPDMLINNAGYMFEGSFMGCETSEIRDCLLVNNIGTLDFAHKFLELADYSKRNYVMFVSSSASFYPMPQMATYSASKTLLNSLSIALRQELKGKNVYVTSICPGSMATNEKMKKSIKSQGIGGKLSLQSTDKVAKFGLLALMKNKAIYVPGAFNKLTHFLSNITPRFIKVPFIEKRWTKCEKKRGDYR